MSNFDIVWPLVAKRTAAFRHAEHDALGEYGPSLRYTARCGDWSGEGWTALEVGDLERCCEGPALDREPAHAQWWREQVWEPECLRQFTTPVAVKLLDISANMASAHQAFIILHRALRAMGYTAAKADVATAGTRTMSAIRDVQMRGQEAALIVAMRSEQAALYRAAASADGLGYRLEGWLRHAYA